MSNTSTPSLWKQLLGAGAGSLIALALYGVYEFASPVVTAWISVPQTQEEKTAGSADSFSDKDESDERYDRLTARTREIAEQFAAQSSVSRMRASSSSEDNSDTFWHPAAASSSSESVAAIHVERRTAWPTETELNTNADSSSSVSSLRTRVQAAARTDSLHAGAPLAGDAGGKGKGPNLPNSGVGVWVGMAGALGGTTALRRKMLTARMRKLLNLE